MRIYTGVLIINSKVKIICIDLKVKSQDSNLFYIIKGDRVIFVTCNQSPKNQQTINNIKIILKDSSKTIHLILIVKGG